MISSNTSELFMVLQLFLMLKVTFKNYYAEKNEGWSQAMGKLSRAVA